MTRRSTASVTLVAAAVLMLGACTTEQQSTPSPTLTSTTSTTTTVADTVATTEAPPDTTATPTTEESTTTTTVASGPAGVLAPMYIGGTDGGWLDLGAWDVDHWQEAFDEEGQPIAIGVAADAAVTVVGLGGTQTGTAGPTVEACFDGRTGPRPDVSVAAPDPPGFGYSAIAASNAAWSLVPRPVAVTARGPDSYQALGESIFANQPVDASNGSVQQVVVSDLDGDGDDEALVSFEFVQSATVPGSPGDFASIFIVDTESRSASTILENSIDASLPPEVFPLLERFRILGVADFNGDGRMEVAVHAWYYEGASVVLYEYDGTTLTEVLANACGT